MSRQKCAYSTLLMIVVGVLTADGEAQKTMLEAERDGERKGPRAEEETRSREGRGIERRRDGAEKGVPRRTEKREEKMVFTFYRSPGPSLGYRFRCHMTGTS